MNPVLEQVTYKEVTIREVYEAMVKNGPDWLRSKWFDLDIDGKVTGACIMGQAAHNLGVASSFTVGFLPGMPIEELDYNQRQVVYENTLFEQMNKFYVPEGSKWETGESAGLASVIVSWNDATVPCPNWQNGTNCDHDRHEYVLKTYQEVLDMAREVMEPHFDEVLRVAELNPELGIIENG